MLVVNNTHSCHNQYTQNGLLKTELNFAGGILSECVCLSQCSVRADGMRNSWGGVWASEEASVGGLDLLMVS